MDYMWDTGASLSCISSVNARKLLDAGIDTSKLPEPLVIQTAARAVRLWAWDIINAEVTVSNTSDGSAP